jgi:3-oxoacid CoA-transferase A subunit
MAINKVVGSFEEAVADICDGAVLLIGGFGGSGESPAWLIRAIASKGVKNLTIVCNSTGWGKNMIQMMTAAMEPILAIPPWWEDASLLVENRQVKKGIASFPASPTSLITTPFEEQLRAGEVKLEIVPQGTLAERIRAAKAGIAAFYTPTGPGTVVEEGKEIRVFDGRKYVLEHAIKGDFSIIRAYKADRYGNLVYSGTSRTFNATMAGASTVTIAEVDEVLELGELDPESIVTPGIYVDRVVIRPEEGRRAAYWPPK